MNTITVIKENSEKSFITHSESQHRVLVVAGTLTIEVQRLIGGLWRPVHVFARGQWLEVEID